MAKHKLIFDDEMEEFFTLIAIHCSEEDYKVAYFLNQHLSTRFKRRRLDIDLPSDAMQINFPIFDFEDELSYSHFYLVANKCRTVEAILQPSGGLFSEIDSEKTTDYFLLPEFKKVDYFLKIYSDFENIALQTLVSQINNIQQIVSAYIVQAEKIKSKNNLTFD